MKKLWNLVKREEGLESAEYAVLGSLIIIAILVTVGLLGTAISDTFQAIVNAL